VIEEAKESVPSSLEIAHFRMGTKRNAASVPNPSTDHLLYQIVRWLTRREEAQEIFDQAYLVDQRSDNREQFRAIGRRGEHLYSVIFEIRRDSGGEYYHLITAWKATKEEEQSYAENI
jgi:uncharacterized DUF497 family protein